MVILANLTRRRAAPKPDPWKSAGSRPGSRARITPRIGIDVTTAQQPSRERWRAPRRRPQTTGAHLLGCRGDSRSPRSLPALRRKPTDHEPGCDAARGAGDHGPRPATCPSDAAMRRPAKDQRREHRRRLRRRAPSPPPRRTFDRGRRAPPQAGRAVPRTATGARASPAKTAQAANGSTTSAVHAAERAQPNSYRNRARASVKGLGALPSKLARCRLCPRRLLQLT